MLTRQTILASALAIGFIGCDTGSVGGPGPSAPDAGDVTTGAAAEFYADNVAQIMAGCTGEACHTGGGTFPPKFLGDGSDTYAAINAFPSVTGNYQAGASSLITTFQPAHPAVGGVVPTYPPGAIATITEWLDLEREERGLGNEVVPNALATFVGCMTLNDWLESQMYRWADKPPNIGGSPCSGCHNQGLARFATPVDDEEMFLMNRYEVFASGFFVVASDGNGGEEVVPAFQKLTARAQGPVANHPVGYDIDDEYYGYLQDFYDRTILNQLNQQCGPPGFAVPPPPEDLDGQN